MMPRVRVELALTEGDVTYGSVRAMPQLSPLVEFEIRYWRPCGPSGAPEAAFMGMNWSPATAPTGTLSTVMVSTPPPVELDFCSTVTTPRTLKFESVTWYWLFTSNRRLPYGTLAICTTAPPA